MDDNEKKDENSGPGLRFSMSKNLEPSGSKNKLVKTVFFLILDTNFGGKYQSSFFEEENQEIIVQKLTKIFEEGSDDEKNIEKIEKKIKKNKKKLQKSSEIGKSKEESGQKYPKKEIVKKRLMELEEKKITK